MQLPTLKQIMVVNAPSVIHLLLPLLLLLLLNQVTVRVHAHVAHPVPRLRLHRLLVAGQPPAWLHVAHARVDRQLLELLLLIVEETRLGLGELVQLAQVQVEHGGLLLQLGVPRVVRRRRVGAVRRVRVLRRALEGIARGRVNQRLHRVGAAAVAVAVHHLLLRLLLHLDRPGLRTGTLLGPVRVGGRVGVVSARVQPGALGAVVDRVDAARVVARTGLDPLLGLRRPGGRQRVGRTSPGSTNAVLNRVLGRDHLGHHHLRRAGVLTRHVLVQQSHDVTVHPLLGNVPRQPVHVVSEVPVGPVVEQDPARLVAALARGQEQRRLVLAVGRVLVGAVGEEDSDGVDVVDGGRPVERRLAVLVGQVHVRFRTDELFDHAFDGETCGQNQRRRTFIRCGVQVCCTVSQQNLQKWKRDKKIRMHQKYCFST